MKEQHVTVLPILSYEVVSMSTDTSTTRNPRVNMFSNTGNATVAVFSHVDTAEIIPLKVICSTFIVPSDFVLEDDQYFAKRKEVTISGLRVLEKWSK